MLKLESNIPIKQTRKKLAQFPRFSLVEKIEPKFFKSSEEGSKIIAQQIKTAILKKQSQNKNIVLGLGSGFSIIWTYAELVRMHKEEKLSFHNVIVFSLDEYYPIAQNDPLSYNQFLHSRLLSKIDIKPENIFLLNGEIPKQSVTSYCDSYQKKIKQFGGIDIQILGVGRNGNVGFNQPPSPINSSTRLIYLHRITRKDAAGAFRGINNVPKCALTMGISTIKSAKRIIMMAWSETKSSIVLKSIQGEASNLVPSTFLQDHPNATFYVDMQAGQLLSRFKVPWTIKGDSEDPTVPRTKYWIIESVMWLSEKVKKPILRLTNDDYEDNGLSPLAVDCARGNVEDINWFVYNSIQQKITGWPLGDKPPLELTTVKNQIRRKSLNSCRVLIFSPHPDDDVISMGGTLGKLVTQCHSVSVAYMTSGSNAVHDYDARKYLYFVEQFSKQYLKSNTMSSQKDQSMYNLQEIVDYNLKKLSSKSEKERDDIDNIIKIKHLIRSSEAKIAVQTLGLNSKNTYCLNLPFYGENKKKQPVSQKDYKIVRDLFKLTEPEYIYIAGDLSDPHGTHRICLEIIMKVINEEYQKYQINNQYRPLVPIPQNIFFYRGAWEQWSISLANYLVLMSPQEVQKKHQSILKHQSQKDSPMFPGEDSRQFWMRVRQRNRQTAKKLQKLGFSEYQAFQCFVDLKTLREYDDI